MCIRVEWNVICDFRSCKNFLQVKKTSFLNKFFIIYNQNSVFYFQKFTEGSLQKEKFTNHANYAGANLTWPELESAPGFRTLSERAATKVATQQHCFGQSRLRLPPPQYYLATPVFYVVLGTIAPLVNLWILILEVLPLEKTQNVNVKYIWSTWPNNHNCKKTDNSFWQIALFQEANFAMI